MVDAATLSYQFNGKLADLRNGVIKSCIQMSLVIKDEVNYPDKFTIKASQKTNWLSTNWPIKIVITAERIGQSYVLLVRGDSSMGSLTQSSNNSAKVDELLTLIKVYAPSQSQQAQNNYIEENTLNKIEVVPVASAADEIRKFKQLLDDGIISQSEFDEKKKQLL